MRRPGSTSLARVFIYLVLLCSAPDTSYIEDRLAYERPMPSLFSPIQTPSAICRPSLSDAASIFVAQCVQVSSIKAALAIRMSFTSSQGCKESSAGRFAERPAGKLMSPCRCISVQEIGLLSLPYIPGWFADRPSDPPRPVKRSHSSIRIIIRISILYGRIPVPGVSAVRGMQIRISPRERAPFPTPKDAPRHRESPGGG